MTPCSSTSEIPTSLSGAAVPFENSVPATTVLPASFYFPITAHPSGGTGLSFWKVCTVWARRFPIRAIDFADSAFPAHRPRRDWRIRQPGAPSIHIPAAVAWQNLPIDTAYQVSYTITGSSWSGGAETLTISGFPNVAHLMGGFTESGLNSACLPASGVSYTGREQTVRF